ncbi:MAG TPA: hypothetical protein VHV51_03195 [Polyangiaceae bacterium]|nr:hypothetical protein [Polyangiaceae bacterium]
MRSLVVGISLVLSFGAGSCKPNAGSSCEKGEARCIDGKHELACEAGKFIETPCSGPRGCSTSEQGTSCDFSGDKPGDPCSADDEGAATCNSKDTMLACHGALYGIVPCRGSKGCALAEGRAACDTSIAQLNDACRDEGLKACASDGLQVLICKDHAMSTFYPCRGANGCSTNAGKLSCDTSIAKLGDPCDKKMEGQAFSCTPDGASILQCKGGAFTLDETCKSGQKCLVDGSSTHCAKPEKK